MMLDYAEHTEDEAFVRDVARVMELQGNTEGSLDLYKAAHLIYALQITSSEFECAGEDAEEIVKPCQAVIRLGEVTPLPARDKEFSDVLAIVLFEGRVAAVAAERIIHRGVVGIVEK